MPQTPIYVSTTPSFKLNLFEYDICPIAKSRIEPDYESCARLFCEASETIQDQLKCYKNFLNGGSNANQP